MFLKRRIEFRILELLKLKGGSIIDKELYEMLKREFDISYSQFLFILMRLELEGLISVRAFKESKIIVLRRHTS